MNIYTQPGLLDSNRWKNLRIGLLGGSFNPPHEGHVHISLAALKGLQLDLIWWLVTPQNPLKTSAPVDMDERLVLCRKITDHPRIIISDIERSLRTRITFDTIKRLKIRQPNNRFVWISGMDNALSLHKWHNWKELLKLIPMVHITRKPATSLIKQCPLRMYDKQNHVFVNQSAKYPLESGTTYWMLQKKMVNISSTEIREKEQNIQLLT